MALLTLVLEGVCVCVCAAEGHTHTGVLEWYGNELALLPHRVSQNWLLLNVLEYLQLSHYSV